MGGKLRAVKRRIGSVKSTQKITRAMELIASSRIVKAQRRVEAARPYAEQMRNLMASVARNAGNLDHPLLKKREGSGKVGMVVVAGDRGLAGAYNSNVIRAAERDMRDHADTELFLSGKKAISYFKFRGYDFTESWQGYSDQPGIEHARKVAQSAVKAFAEGKIDEVRLAYTKYESALTQRPVVLKLLPAETEDIQGDEDSGSHANYVFEPEPEDILGYLLPRYIEGAVLQAMLEAAASEHAARRRAMKAATDNADELIDSLTRDYNQARQAEITTEIMEVIGGAEALSAAETESGLDEVVR
ncbi:MAG: F-type H+-transporting ATPase subunit gamma [Actinomycetota bacterium]|jgi:F-type H+-transporting ATPase subunit gamma|nr:F-type H+-transporting ATPase subunit gamma [Actinomycetota bacterium]